MKANLKGFTLLATLFILIILAMAGVYLIKIGLTQQQIVNYTLLTTRAKLATTSALDLAQQQFLAHPQECVNATYHFDKKYKALTGYNVEITCLQQAHFPIQNPTFFALQLKAKATRGEFGSRDYVSHQMSRWLILENPSS